MIMDREQDTRMSRRSLVTIAAVSLAGAAVAASPASPAASIQVPALTCPAAIDPALVAIRECQDALEAYKAALNEYDHNFDEELSTLEVRADEAMDASLDAWEALFDVTPTTPAGAAALASYMLTYTREEGGADTAEEALTGLASCLERFAAGVGQDNSMSKPIT